MGVCQVVTTKKRFFEVITRATGGRMEPASEREKKMKNCVSEAPNEAETFDAALAYSRLRGCFNYF